MRTVAIIQARLASTRLPGKVLYELGGRTVLEWVVRRTKAARLVNEVIVATTNEPEDGALVGICHGLGVECFTSPDAETDDVLSRYVQCVLPEDDIIVRITADCPLIDPAVIDSVVEPLTRPGNNLFSSNVWWERNESCGWPDGLDVEAFRRYSLEEADRNETYLTDREHVCHWMHRNIENAYTQQGPSGLSDIRWTLDTPEDYAHLRMLVTANDVPEKLGLETLLQREFAL